VAAFKVADWLDDAVMGARLVGGLRTYLQTPLTLPGARTILRHRFENREADFLALAKDAVFAHRRSPYRALLRLAGCEYGDLERLVYREGVEGACRTLLREGVYLTVDEFKGRRPVVRGSTTLEAGPLLLQNPLATRHFWGLTGGSRGASTRFPLDLACLRDRAVNLYLSLDAQGGAAWRKAVWGTPSVTVLLWYSICGGPAAAWFSQVDPELRGLHPRYRWSIRAISWASRLTKAPLPRFEHVPLDAPLPIARWMRAILAAGETPHLWAFPSSAVTLCRAAEDAGIEIAGARFTITGEPVTTARLSVIRRAGAVAVPDYGSADSGGSVTYGCLNPEAPDDVHLFQDLNALIQADASPFPDGALLVSSLRRTVPFVLLNVSMGDRAIVTDRRCGCPMETLGWRTHLHTIRSFEKLTAGGMTFVDTDVARVLEQVLPGRFGGSPVDYQLVEGEAEDGQPQLSLFVHPRVGPLDTRAIAEAFLDAIGTGSGAARIMAHQWREGRMLRVEREPPRAGMLGKILHVWAPRATRADGATGGSNRPG
jgi:hypothetical protein